MSHPISHSGAGLTLIELMIVIAMLATLSVGAVLALRPRATDRDPALLTEIWERQRSMAITGQERRGLNMTPRGIEALRWTADGWQVTGQMQLWQARAVVAPTEIAAPDQPQVVFLPDGRSNGFEIRWTGTAPCRSTGGVTLSCDN